MSLAGAALSSTVLAEEMVQPVRPSLTPGQYASFDQWVTAARAAASEFLGKSTPDPERLMQFLALWVTAVPDPPEPKWQEAPGANAKLEFSMLSPGRPFVLVGYRMAPGCLLPAHCHPGGGGISLCLGGSLTIQHYNLVDGSPPFSETGAVAEVEDVSTTQLRKGQFTLFTPTRSNLHQLRAGPAGALAMDVNVLWSGTGKFSFLKLSEDAPPAPDAAGRHRGTWIGMDLARAYPDVPPPTNRG